MTDIHYHPETGDILPNGHVRVPTSGRAADGEIWDGQIEIGPDDPRYAAWAEMARCKEQFLEAARQRDSEARRRRRQTRRAALSEEAGPNEAP